MGAGTISVPYVFYENGVILGFILLFLAALLSCYTGWLVSYCAEITGGKSFEEIAMKLYGKKGMKITTACNLLCNIGFLISYIILFKQMMPFTIKTFYHPEADIPYLIGDNIRGHFLWVTFFSFLLLLPLSLPRQLNKLRFISLFSFLISLFITFTILSICFKETE